MRSCRDGLQRHPDNGANLDAVILFARLAGDRRRGPNAGAHSLAGGGFPRVFRGRPDDDCDDAADHFRKGRRPDPFGSANYPLAPAGSRLRSANSPFGSASSLVGSPNAVFGRWKGEQEDWMPCQRAEALGFAGSDWTFPAAWLNAPNTPRAGGPSTQRRDYGRATRSRLRPLL